MNRRLLFLSTAKAALASALGGSLLGASAMRAGAQEVRPRRIVEAGPPTAPPNPHLARSEWPITLGNMCHSTGWGPPPQKSRRLSPDEILYQHIGVFNMLVPVFSSPYPDGTIVRWCGGNDRILKFDAATGRILAELMMPGKWSASPQFAEEMIATFDTHHRENYRRLDQFIEDALKIYEPLTRGFCAYNLVDAQNNYIVFTERDTVSVYGDAEPGNPRSPIVQRRSWTIPKDLASGAFMAPDMSYDGHLIMITTDGVLMALDKDFRLVASLRAPRDAGAADTGDITTGFVRNAITIDPDNHIYFTARNKVYRVKWTGKSFSLDPKDAGWIVPIPDETGRGSGTTPRLMGFGSPGDKLVLLGDGSKKVNLVALWADRIPDDWTGMPGLDRRIAGMAPVTFGATDFEANQIENAVAIIGNGAYLGRLEPKRPLPDLGPQRILPAQGLIMSSPDYQPRGAQKFVWDEKQRKLRTEWENQELSSEGTQLVTSRGDLIFNVVMKDGYWTLVAWDWKTGAQRYALAIGESQRFNPYYSHIVPNPFGHVEYAGPFGSVTLLIGS